MKYILVLGLHKLLSIIKMKVNLLLADSAFDLWKANVEIKCKNQIWELKWNELETKIQMRVCYLVSDEID